MTGLRRGPIGEQTFTQDGTGASAREAQGKMREWVSFCDFQCDDGQFVQLDGVHDDSTGIQKCLDYARLTGLMTRPGKAGIAGLGQRIYFPDGCNFRGEGFFEGGGGVKSTLFKALAGFTSGSVLGVYGHDGGARRFWGGDIGHFVVHGNVLATGQYGLEFTDELNRKICPQDVSYIHDMFFRYCPSGGALFPDGLLPGVIERFRPFKNGGPGLTIDNQGNRNSCITINGLSGDGNNGGLLLLQNFNNDNIVSIRDLKAERIESPDFAGGDEQVNPIVLEDCDGLRLMVNGASSISAQPDGANFKKPGNLVHVASGAEPSLTWQNVAIRVRVGDTGADPCIIDFSGQAVPYTVPNGSFAPSTEERVDVAPDGWRMQTLGGPYYKARSVENPAHQTAGDTPGRSYYEDDAAADTKMWLEVASGGNLTRRTVSDDGSTNTIYERVTRSGASPTKVEYLIPAGPGPYTTGTIPGAGSHTNMLAMVTNPAAGKGRLVYSDGTDWRYVSDDSVI